MIKLEIVEIDNYDNYVLKDNKGKIYDVNINFMNIDKPKEGTIIYISKSVIDEKVSLNYGPVSDKPPLNENEIIILLSEKEKKYLERYYG